MDEKTTLENLAAQFLEEHRRWLNPSIEAYQERYSELSDEIAELFPVLLAMEQWKGIKEIDESHHGFRIPSCDEFLGETKLIREIGRGDLSIVYAGRQEHLNREVAVKILPCHIRNSKRMRDRFEREARTVARLQHRNIISIYNYGESEKYCHYTMQLVQGAGIDWVVRRLNDYETNIHPDEFLYALNPKLRARNYLRKKEYGRHHREIGKDSWRAFACVTFQTLKALTYAHQQGTLHNNIKPSNIMLDKNGHIWLTDFGLAQFQLNESAEMNENPSSEIRYMAPERFKNISEECSDLYSVGAVLYELCTLSPLISEGPPRELIDRILHEEHKKPREIRAEIPEELEAIILKSLQKEPGERYSSAKQMGNELLAFINGKSN